jgi:hypothetical protein
MRIEYRQSGSWGRHAITVEDLQYSLKFQDEVKVARALSISERDGLAALVERLEQAQPRMQYGGSNPVSCASDSSLRTEHTRPVYMRVITDSFDHPPQEYYDLVDRLHKLTRAP